MTLPVHPAFVAAALVAAAARMVTIQRGRAAAR